jgi:hypothetical protein
MEMNEIIIVKGKLFFEKVLKYLFFKDHNNNITYKMDHLKP